jgi:hypothetical protein
VHDIIIDSNDVSSADDSAAATWTLAQWQSIPRTAALVRGDPSPKATCISLTNNRFHNVANGVAIFSNNTLFAYNQIDHFTADALDYAGNNLQINRNYIHDVVTTPSSPTRTRCRDRLAIFRPGSGSTRSRTCSSTATSSYV